MTTKLELTWPGKQEDSINPEPRILIEDPKLSNVALDPDTSNMLIHGDNLMALKALEHDFAGKVKCVYIDPPYNTGSAFEHYDDNFEHSTWLGLMKPRLELLRRLLAEDGAICVQIDITEMAYLKVIMDEIFSRRNFINMITVKTKVAGLSGGYLGKSLQDNTEFILIYAKDLANFSLKIIPQKKQELMEYIKFYDEQGKSWKYTSVMMKIDEGNFIKTFPTGNGDTIKLYRHEAFQILSIRQAANSKFHGSLKDAYYSLIDDVFRTTNAQTSIRTRVIEETQEKFNGKGLFSIVYVPVKGKNAGKVSRYYYKDGNLIAWLKDVIEFDGNRIIKLDNTGNLWEDIQYNNLTKEGSVHFPNGKKPEELIKRLIEMLSCPGDLVLDSFLGSGTTAAVAHKMGRRYIGVEIGDHAYTHCKARLDKVIAGEDQGGITKSVNWTGGCGYRFYELAPTLVNTDEYGQAKINPAYDGEMLAKAVALHEGFTYSPDETCFWKQSKGSEKSYLYVTPNFMSREAVEAIHNMMNYDEYLIIACPACDSGIKIPNIVVKKIPQSILGCCEFDKSDYNLNVDTTANLVDNGELLDYEDDENVEDFEQIEQSEKTNIHAQGNHQLSLDFEE